MLIDGKNPAGISQTAKGSGLAKTNGDGNIAPRPLMFRDTPAYVGLAVFLAALL